MAITAGNATYGADVPVSVAVTGESSPTGSVTLTDGGTTVGTAALANGKATFTLAKPLAGSHALAAAYTGDVNTASGSGNRTVAIAKSVPTVTVTAGDAAAGEDVAVSVAVPAAATGTVVLKEGSEVLGTTAISSGTATFTLTDLGAGEHALVASYAGDANHEAASGTTRVAVGQATAKAKVGWATKPSAGQRGTAVVKVSDLASGKATAIVRTASGKKVRALTARIKDGSVRFALPKLARGKYVLVVKVPGNDDVAKATSTRTFRVK